MASMEHTNPNGNGGFIGIGWFPIESTDSSGSVDSSGSTDFQGIYGFL